MIIFLPLYIHEVCEQVRNFHNCLAFSGWLVVVCYYVHNLCVVFKVVSHQIPLSLFSLFILSGISSTAMSFQRWLCLCMWYVCNVYASLTIFSFKYYTLSVTFLSFFEFLYLFLHHCVLLCLVCSSSQ